MYPPRLRAILINCDEIVTTGSVEMSAKSAVRRVDSSLLYATEYDPSDQALAIPPVLKRHLD